MAKRILIIEDDPAFAGLIAAFLESKGFKVEQAFDGEKGLEMAVRSKPDLVILDIMLPKKHGYEVCEKIRQRWPSSEMPILAVTSKSYDADKNAARSVGADGYLTKPCHLEDLIQAVESLLK